MNDCENLVLETNKRKLLFEYEQNIKKKVNTGTQHTGDLKICLKLYPMIADQYSRPTETEKMFVGRINLKKETSRLIKQLSVVWPLEKKSHLKRVRWTPQKDVFEILLRPVHENELPNKSESYSLDYAIGQRDIDTTGLMDSVVICEVPKHPALTYQQYKDSLQFWPVQFREDKYIEKILKNEIFSTDEKEKIEMFMKMCLSASQYGDEKVGCVIVDPVESKVMSIAHDRRHQHPIQHAVMVAVDLVAKNQGGGSWDIDSEHAYHLPYSKDEIEKKIEELRKLNPGRDVKKLALPYLCTGYDAYVSREPCVMCAMALVHSRIRRVFYASAASWGALGSHCKLHLLDGLNHHYEVWKVELEYKTMLHNSCTQIETTCNPSS